MGKKDRCKKGKPCGMACISQTKICRKDTPGNTSKELGKTAKNIESRKPPVPPAPKPPSTEPNVSKPEDFASVGKKTVNKYRDIQVNLRVIRKIAMLKKAIKAEEKEGGLSLLRRLNLKRRYFALIVRENKAEDRLKRAMNLLRKEMLIPKISNEALDKLVSRVNFSGFEGKELGRVKGDLREFAMMFNGRGLKDAPSVSPDEGKRLMSVRRLPLYEGNRSYAKAKEGSISLSANSNKNQLFHELGHIVETQNEKIFGFAERWRNNRAFSEDEIRRLYPAASVSNKEVSLGTILPSVMLRDLHPNVGYKPSELAVVDSYMRSYMGKFYILNATEVISVAMENFSDVAGMSALAKFHPDLFEYVVGMAMS